MLNKAFKEYKEIELASTEDDEQFLRRSSFNSSEQKPITCIECGKESLRCLCPSCFLLKPDVEDHSMGHSTPSDQVNGSEIREDHEIV